MAYRASSNPHQEQLQQTLGGNRGSTDPRNTTMPVSAPTQGPWNRGEIRGGARQGADFARLGGGFGQADTDSMKHTFGRIAQNFDTTDAGLQALVNDPEFRALFPNATLSKDWIDFGGQLDPHTGTRVGKVDVQRGWVQGGRGGPWQWLTEDEALAGSPAASGGQSRRPLMAGESGLMAQILASLQAMQQPDPQALLIQQLVR